MPSLGDFSNGVSTTANTHRVSPLRELGRAGQSGRHLDFVKEENEEEDENGKGIAADKNQGKEEDEEVLTSCGIGRWRPAWMQRFASPVYFMANMALVGVIQGMTATIILSSITTLEKRYAFDSKLSALILIADNFAEVFLNPVVGYFGVRFNRARLIAFGEMLLAGSCFLSALPYFLYGPANHLTSVVESSFSSITGFGNHSVSDSLQMCSSASSKAHLAEECASGRGTTVWPAVVILFAGSFLRGLGLTCYLVIGLPYLDDNVQKNRSPIYIAIMQSIRLLGPACGFILSGFCLKYYENPFVDPGFGRNDPRFIGAWWLGFCIIGVLLFFVSLPLFCFPRQFQNSKVKATELSRKIKENGGSVGAFKRVITNPVVMFFVLAHIFRMSGLGGFTMFKSKYIESQYRQSSSGAGFLTGFSSYLPMAIGIVLGAGIISYLKPRPRIIFILVFLTESASLFSVGSGFFLGCDPINIAGELDLHGQFSPQSSCSGTCECSTEVYTPICGPDSKTTYFSPCFAGCTAYNARTSSFENCACFSGAATKGYCESDVTNCKNLYKFITFVTSGSIISSIGRTPSSLIALRSVDPMDKGFAIGFTATLMDIFAFMQYPVTFGYIIDSACLVWEKKCGKTGNCWVYDHDKFRKYLHTTAFTLVALGCVFDLGAIFFVDRVQNFYDEEVEEKPKGDEQSKEHKDTDSSTDKAGQIELDRIMSEGEDV